MTCEKQQAVVIVEEAHIAALVDLSRPNTGVLELLQAEGESFPSTLAVLTGNAITPNLQSKEDLIAIGTNVVRNLLVDQGKWSDEYDSHIRGLMEGLWYVERWENYRHIGGPENGLQHSLRDLHLVVILSSLEEREGNHPDLQFLFPAFTLHDIGEIGMGDTLYRDKTSGREREEYERFCQLISFLSPQEQERWKRFYLGQYIRFSREINQERFEEITPSPLIILDDLQERYFLEGQIFDAAERLGYLLYAMNCFTKHYGIEPLIQVLRNQHHHLVCLSEKLPSLGKYIYTREVKNWVEDLLRVYQGLYLEEQS